jgi:hypothetical protein
LNGEIEGEKRTEMGREFHTLGEAEPPGLSEFWADAGDIDMGSEETCNVGCYISYINVCIYQHADGIVLLTHTITGLHKLQSACDYESNLLEMKINIEKNNFYTG